MRTCIRILFLCVPLILGSGLLQAGEPTIRILGKDDSKFSDEGIIQFFVDILDARDRVVEVIQPENLKFSVDGQPEAGKVTVANLQGIGKGSAVMLVIPTHDRFVQGESGKKAFRRVISGAKSVIEGMQPQDRVAIAVFENGRDYRVKFPFSSDFETAISELEKLGGSIERDEGTAEKDLPRLLATVLKQLLKNEFKGNLPANQAILLITAGYDHTVENASSKAKANKVSDLAELALRPQEGKPKRIFVVGVEGFNDSDRLAPFRSLASQTGGGYTQIKEEAARNEYEEITEAMRVLGDRILKQHVLTWIPEDWSGGQATVRIQASIKGTTVHDELKRRWAEKPFPILKVILIVLGSLLGVFLLIVVVRGIAGRDRRPRQVEQAAPEPGPGAARAMLQITTGPHAGDEAYLVAEVTTMGKSDACDYQFNDAQMSRRHAAIRIEDMRFELSDLKSTNGTFVNGRKIEKSFLQDGDHILMGGTEMVFKLLR